MNSSKLKAKARKNLKKNLYPFTIATTIFIALILFCSLIGFIVQKDWLASLLMIVVEGLFMMGLIRMANKTADNKTVTINDFSSRTELFFKYIGLYLIIFFIIFVLFLLLTIAFKSLVAIMFYHGEISMALSIFMIALGLLLVVAILLVTLYIGISFSQVLFILDEEPKLSIREILGRSFDLTEGYAVDYFSLLLSFIGWFILGILTLGILFIWIAPYMMVTMACFYQQLKKDYQKYIGKQKVEKIINDADALEATITEKIEEVKETTTKKTAKPKTSKAKPKTSKTKSKKTK